jgi:hypothetical protein
MPNKEFLPMRNLLLSILCLTLALACQVRKPDSSTREIESEQALVMGKSLELKRITGVKTSQGHFALNKVFDDPSKGVFLGVNATGHVYLMAGGLRFDGELYFRASETSTSQLADEGLLFHFPNLPPETVARVQQSIKDADRSKFATCAQGACSLLNRSGVHTKTTLGVSHTRAIAVLNDLFSGGVTDDSGQPIDVHVYATPQIDVSAMLDRSRSREKEVLIHSVYLAVGGGTTLSAAGQVLFYLSTQK